jgi:hypothetical protein
MEKRAKKVRTHFAEQAYVEKAGEVPTDKRIYTKQRIGGEGRDEV